MQGVVQGVGFRPFVHGLARQLGLVGFVGNDTAGVFCQVEGDRAAVARFMAALRDQAPPLAIVETVTAKEVPARGEAGFTIVASEVGGARATLVSADTATCDECLAELFDPADRRYRYPFINCTHCGPRFSIVRDVPYDRANTTMAAFVLCRLCAAEYHDPVNRRFHAQPVCCPDCGPQLQLLTGERACGQGDPLRGGARLLLAGAVLAVKGLGGYHLAARAADEAAVSALRSRKHREDKPFALMAADVEMAQRLCRLGPPDVAMLTSRARPIVLAPRHPDAAVAAAVAPGNRWIGVMLPYTPLHHLLVREVGEPIVLTSGNVSDEPIAYTDPDAAARLAGIADAFLCHDRPIHVRTDDSVVRTFRGRPLPVRRARGYAPEPLRLARPLRRPVLGCGAELKSTFCLASGSHAFLSHHIGDLENFETYLSYTDGIDHFRRLFEIEPELVVHDLHPEYLSTKFAQGLDGVELMAVQHHHAHVAACLADHQESGPVLGVAFDGLGLGPDGTIWGGELLVADLAGFERASHLSTVRMPGGTAAIREPWRMAVAWLDAAFDAEPPADLAVIRRHGEGWERVRAVAQQGAVSPLTSSAGRLFDAVAAIVGVRDVVNYEGQAAVELEQVADPSERGAYDMEGLEASDLIRAVVADLQGGVAPPAISARFHNGLAAGTVRACTVAARRAGLDTVVLSGGVFQNALLLERVVAGLAVAGLRPLVHSRVPPNDAGISLGQVAIGGAR